jgi:CHAT domain-containing protein
MIWVPVLALLVSAAGQAADTTLLRNAWAGIWQRPFAESVVAFEAAAADARAQRNDAGVAMAHSGLGFLRSRLHGVTPALAHFDTALAAAPADQPAAEAFARCARASIRSFGGVPGAADDARRGLERARASRLDRALGWCWHAQASVAINEARNPGLILALLDSAAAAQRAAGDDEWLGITLFTQGYALQYLGHLDAAKRVLGEARRLAEASGNRFTRAWTLRFLGDIHAATGDAVSADQEYRAAFADFSHLGDGVGLRGIRRVMASVAAAVGRLEEAERTFLELRAAAEAAGFAEAVYTVSLELAIVRWLRGDYEGSLAETERAAAYGLRTGHQGMVAHLDYGRGLHALRRGRPAEAERYLRNWLRSTAPSLLADRYAARARLAEALVRQGRLDAGVAELTGAMDQLDSVRATMEDRTLRTLVFQTRNAYDDPDFGLATIAAALVSAGRVGEAFTLSQRRRARMLADRLLRDRLAQDGSAGGRAASQASAITAEQARAWLPAGSAMVEFLAGRGGQPSVMFIVTRGNLIAAVLPPLDSAIAEAERFAGLLASGESASALGRRLAEQLVDPWLGLLPDDVKQLHLVPDGALHRIPFDALILSGNRYLLDRYAVSVAPSAAVARALRARPAWEGLAGVLAFGDPRFAEERDLSGAVDGLVYREAFDSAGGLPRLRASAGEARAVAAYGADAMVRLRGAASESFLKRVAPDRFRVIHFATHALVDERASARTVLALAPGDGEDGFLGAGELAGLGLAADLVVLSACRTAGGAVIEGEGIQGLTAPFLEGGAGVVVATLWPLPDRVAARFVAEFYRALATGVAVGNALATAKRARRDAGASPSEWAAFVAVGDPHLVIPLRSPGGGQRTVLVVAVLVLLALAGLLLAGRLRARAA